MCIQAGLATKVEKASRKLRKERKNRSKKVRNPSRFPATRLSSFSSTTVPWHQKGQGCRAPEEGQIVGSPRCYGLLLLFSSHCMFIYPAIMGVSITHMPLLFLSP